MLGVLIPDMQPYIDMARLGELVTDGVEPLPELAVLSINPRLRHALLAAQGYVTNRLTVANRYTVQQLRDLISDAKYALPTYIPYDPLTGIPGHWVGIAGQQMMAIVADAFWCRLISRKRYPADGPQGKDMSCQMLEEELKSLQSGETILTLNGVVQHEPISDGSGEKAVGLYGNDVAMAGLMFSGNLSTDMDCLYRLWGCMGPCWDKFRKRCGC